MLGVSVAGTALSAVGRYRAGKAQAAAFEYNADIDRKKAVIAEDRSRARLRRLMGSQRALYAKAGVDLSSGSPLEVLAFTAAEGEKEALNIRQFGQEAGDIGDFSADAARQAGNIGAGATLLTGLGQAAGTFFQTKRGSKQQFITVSPKMSIR
jgi:hypothetical protein